MTWGRKHIRCRRSEDGGKTWGEPITIVKSGIQGGGTTVEESSNEILVFVEEKHPPAPVKIYRSKDDGLTWKAETPKIEPDKNGNIPSMHMNDNGITLRRGKRVWRLIRPTRYYGKKNDRSEWPNHYTNSIYSDDAGKSWKTSDPFPENGTGEAAIVELSDGRLYYNSRIHWNERPRNTRRREAWSTDEGLTWKDWKIVDALPDGQQHRSYGCMGGLTRLAVKGKDFLIFSNLDTPAAKRENGTVWASFDGAKTWPIKRLLQKGPSAYSSLTSGRPGTPSEGWIYMFYESGGGKIARFNLSWLLGGKATGDGKVPTELLK